MGSSLPFAGFEMGSGRQFAFLVDAAVSSRGIAKNGIAGAHASFGLPNINDYYLSLSLSRTPFLRYALLHLGREEDFGALGGEGIKYAHSNEV